jgi:signal transduction histidine kinase
LCVAFVGAIAFATYSLIQEKLIAIDFVRKELIGAKYAQAIRDGYSLVPATFREAPYNPNSQTDFDSILNSLTTVEEQSSFETEHLFNDLVESIRGLRTQVPGASDALVLQVLTKAQDLISRVGDESNLSLDPDLDSYYIQNIVIKGLPDLLSKLGELHSIFAQPLSDPARTHAMLLDGMIRSSVEGIERDAAASYRGNADGHVKPATGRLIESMTAAVRSYLKDANAVLSGQGNSSSLNTSFAVALRSTDNVWNASNAELTRLLTERRYDLVGKLFGSLVLNALVAGLSLLFALMAYRQIALPLRKLEDHVTEVGKTKDYSLRINLDSKDEIGQLASAFNGMMAELSAARDRERADHERNAAMQADLARAARLTTVGEMAASIAHEVNQPLAAVVNNANAGLRWLSHQPPNLDEVQKALRRIAKDGERGSGIIDSIRTLSKKGDRKKTKLDLNELIFDVASLAQSQFKRHGAKLHTELADDLPMLTGDRVQIQQVLLNLLINAAEAAAAASDVEPLVRIRSARQDGGCASISVEDSGAGINPEDVSRIFEAFFTTKPEGTGMGLSICRSIIESHGGRITVANAAPHGAVFNIILPGDRAPSP